MLVGQEPKRMRKKCDQVLSRIARSLLWATCIGTASLPARAQLEPRIIEIGPHHRVIQRLVAEPQPDGSVAERVSSYTELGTGLHYKSELGQWLESQPQFELFGGGAVARQGPFQLIVSPDLSDKPTVDVLTPDSKRLQISPRWIAIFNRATRQSTMIAAIKPCVGQLVAPNVVVFFDAFDDTRAAIRLTYQSWGIEQDAVLLESGSLSPQAIGAAGLDANSPDLVLEMWSEVHVWPEPVELSNVSENGLNDVRLSFGEARLGAGKAFSLGAEDDSIPVYKTWTQVDRRQFLIEAVRYADVAPLLARLPQQAQADPPGRRVRDLARRQPVFALPR
jgi:hypothetical protein